MYWAKFAPIAGAHSTRTSPSQLGMRDVGNPSSGSSAYRRRTRAREWTSWCGALIGEWVRGQSFISARAGLNKQIDVAERFDVHEPLVGQLQRRNDLQGHEAHGHER